MMGATPPAGTPRLSPGPSMTGMGDDMFDEKALAAALSQNPFFGGQQQQATATKPAAPPSMISKFMPLIHLVCMWGLLGYFAFWMYPASAGIEGDWREAANRWSVLSERSGYDSLYPQYWASTVPFFWTFAAVQLALHSSRITLGYDAIELPTVLSLALPALPPTVSSIVTNGLKYLKMISVFLDDVSVLLLGVAFIIYASTWLVN